MYKTVLFHRLSKHWLWQMRGPPRTADDKVNGVGRLKQKNGENEKQRI